jgi:multiple sugar transport system ATP-binding protein
MIAGLEQISAGEIAINGRIVNDDPPRERDIAMVFQDYALYPHMTVRQNIGFGLKMRDAPKAKIAEAVAKVAGILQIEHLLERKPKQLSGGQRQRVAIGRAIVRDPKVFLFDEPLSNLDAALRMDMRMEIGKLHQSLKASMIYVTHDQVEAMTLADKIVVLKDGRVMQVGTPMELYHEPANLFVAGFLGAPSMNFIKVDVTDVSGDEATVRNVSLEPIRIALKGREIGNGDAGILGVRPQYLRPEDPERAMVHGTVALTERLGAETVVEVVLADGGRIIAAIGEDKVFAPGSDIGLSFDPAQAHLFADEAVPAAAPH